MPSWKNARAWTPTPVLCRTPVLCGAILSYVESNQVVSSRTAVMVGEKVVGVVECSIKWVEFRGLGFSGIYSCITYLGGVSDLGLAWQPPPTSVLTLLLSSYFVLTVVLYIRSYNLFRVLGLLPCCLCRHFKRTPSEGLGQRGLQLGG
jgi:hypothetical protein